MTWFSLFMCNWLLNIVVIEFLAIRKLGNVIKVDEERDEKYKAFRRNDVKFFSRWWLYLTCQMMLWRFSFAFFCMFWNMLFSKVIVIGLKEGDPVVGWRLKLCRFFYFITARVIIAAMGCFWITYERPEVCYKKYLGEDWVADYDQQRTSTVVCNHSAFHDSMMHGLRQFPSIVAKGEVRNIPFLGPIAKTV
jgi:hypothetical protein